jgi:hypothetical protein
MHNSCSFHIALPVSRSGKNSRSTKYPIPNYIFMHACSAEWLRARLMQAASVCLPAACLRECIERKVNNLRHAAWMIFVFIICLSTAPPRFCWNGKLVCKASHALFSCEKPTRERHFCRTCAIIINSLIDLIARLLAARYQIRSRLYTLIP